MRSKADISQLNLPHGNGRCLVWVICWPARVIDKVGGDVCSQPASKRRRLFRPARYSGGSSRTSSQCECQSYSTNDIVWTDWVADWLWLVVTSRLDLGSLTVRRCRLGAANGWLVWQTPSFAPSRTRPSPKATVAYCTSALARVSYGGHMFGEGAHVECRRRRWPVYAHA